MYRKPAGIERLYIDFDCFFASVEQQLNPGLQNRPVAVLPFMSGASCVIAASRELRRYGVATGMRVRQARRLCPRIIFVPARHDVYVRLHHRIYQVIEDCVHIDQACSIDEVVCTLAANEQRRAPQLARQIKTRLAQRIGPCVTCSIGFAPNQLLAKTAAEADKPDGMAIWQPQQINDRLLALALRDLPGIGEGMARRLQTAGINDTQALLALPPERMRRLWGSIEGERFWHSLHGYAVDPAPTTRRMFGHSRILTPANRGPGKARLCARLLTVKAARRLRRAGFLARRLTLSIRVERRGKWSVETGFVAAADDHTFLEALSGLWLRALAAERRDTGQAAPRIKQVSVSLSRLTSAKARRPDLFGLAEPARAEQRRRQALAETMDEIVRRYGPKAASLGVWEEPPGGYAGAKIAFGRIPSLADF